MADIVRPGEAAGGPLNATAMPSNFNLVIYKGDYAEIIVTVKDSVGAAINLTGSEPEAQLKSDYEDATPIDFDCSFVNDGTDGKVRIFLSSAVSSTLTPGDYIWDFQITDTASRTRTYLAGDVVVYPEVTT